MNYDDAFTLEPVAEQLLDNFNFVAGIVPILTTHVEKVYTCGMNMRLRPAHNFFCATCWHVIHSYQYGGKSPPPLNSESTNLVSKALENLSEFMSTPNARENKNRQKLLRNLKVGLAST